MKYSFRRLRFLSSLLPLSFLSMTTSKAQTLPVPDHIVILIEENYSYADIMTTFASSSPHIHALAADTNAATFTSCFALSHPSEPNYLYFYSGNNQGCTDDGIPAGNPFNTANLGAELIAASKTFVTYCEDMPSVGYNGATYTTGGANYVRKHNPVTNWMGTGTNQVPTTVNQPYTSFPFAANYASLPTVSYVVPNQNNDMHDGTPPGNIATGDTWFYNHLDSFKQWALTHNSLLILTFDEDDNISNNQILTIFYGPMVKGGNYSYHETLVNILGTIESMYGLGHAGAPFASGITDTPITYCWRTTPSSVNNVAASHAVNVFPNPASDIISFRFDQPEGSDMIIEITDITGRTAGKYTMKNSSLSVSTALYPSGIYFYKAYTGNKMLDAGKFMIAGH